jgi:nitroreductase
MTGKEKDAMEAIELLKTRRSVRKFKPGEIDDAVLGRVLDTAVYAPTGRGLQAPQIIVVHDEETLAQLRRMNAAILGSGKDPYYGAGTIILVLSPNDVTTYIEDGACVLAYMMLAAHAEGLASVWVHREREMFDSPEGKALKKKWGIPDKFEGIGSLAVGYADGDYPKAAPRRDGYILRI